jgi:hypothetical protein
MPKKTSRKSVGRRARCSLCGGGFGVIRFRFELREFCSKRCLNRYLASRIERPWSLKEWIEEVRKAQGR